MAWGTSALMSLRGKERICVCSLFSEDEVDMTGGIEKNTVSLKSD